MESKRSRSIALIIRRIIAAFLFFSTVMGVIADIETNVPFDETLSGVIVSLLVIYFLARPPKNKNKNKNKNVEVDVDNTDSEEIDDLPDIEEDFEDVEETADDIEYQKGKASYKTEKIKKSNPVRDRQSILSRIFQGRTDRY